MNPDVHQDGLDEWTDDGLVQHDDLGHAMGPWDLDELVLLETLPGDEP